MLRQFPNTLAIVYAETWMVMVSTIVRQVALLLALAFAVTGADMVWVASSGLAGEILAFMTISVLHNRRHHHAFRLWVKPLVILTMVALFLFALVSKFNEYDYFVAFLAVSRVCNYLR